MRELFGMPVGALAVVLGALLGVAAVLVGGLAARHRVLLKIGVRNLGRRRGRTAIIVAGLMLGTMIIGSALGFGDIMASTVRTSVISSLGQTDEMVSARSADTPDIATLGSGGGSRYLTAAEADRVVSAAVAVSEVDGAAAAISEPVAVQDVTSRRTEPALTLFGLDPAGASDFGPISTTTGTTVSLTDLTPGEGFLDEEAADDLDARPGDRLVVFAGGQQVELTVREVVAYDGAGSAAGAVLVPLAEAQRILDVGRAVQHVLVSNDGDAVGGEEQTDAVMAALGPTVEALELRIDPVKQDGLATADEQGATFLSLFSSFGTFTISAGILLIFLVFVMLAAERRGEMGTARAIGMQRRSLVQMFVYEGAAYDALAALAGAVLGLLLALGMVRVIAGAMSASGIATIRYDLTWTSFLLSFALGALLTLTVVLIAAWRVSRLNIVAAVRNLPQPPRRRRRRFTWLAVLGCLTGGGVLVMSAVSTGDAVALLVGGSLLLFALAPVIRSLGRSDRLAYSVAGACVVAWNLLPFRFYEVLVPDLEMGFGVFVAAGLLLIAGATAVVVHNLRLVLGGLMWLAGPSRLAAPVVKTAIAEPMRNRFRTGTTLGLFSLVVFTLVSGATISSSFLHAIDDEATFSGGYDVTAQTSPLSPVSDMDAALADAPGIDPAEVESYAAQSYIPLDARQVGHERYAGYVVRGLDDAFLNHTTYGFAARAKGYDSDRDVWNALARDPGLAVVDSYSVPRRGNWGTATTSDFRLSGFYLEDEAFTPVDVQLRETGSGKTIRLRVIGVLSDKVPFAMVGISTSQQTLEPLGGVATPTVWYFDLRPGVDPVATADHLEAAFLDHGMQATAQRDALREAVSSSLTFQYLVLGFLGLGLVIGVAALGVISARAVVERRQQIGVLRAIGFQARMVQLTFLVEAMFVTVLSLAIGAGLGFWIAWNVVTDTARQPGWQNLQLAPPWPALAAILLVVLIATLLTTWLPSVRASRTYPAAALRYE